MRVSCSGSRRCTVPRNGQSASGSAKQARKPSEKKATRTRRAPKKTRGAELSERLGTARGARGTNHRARFWEGSWERDAPTRELTAFDAPPEPRERLRLILQTLSGARSIDAACRALRVSPTRFQQLRLQTLQGAVEALEPGRPRRPREHDAATDARITELQTKLAL